MIKFYKPDYNNCVLNVTSTLAEFFNAPNANATLPVLKRKLSEKPYEKIVFAIFDGLGSYPIKVNLSDDDFLVKNTAQTLYSTFPSTTTNATTSINTNKQPLEHGWFGWKGYFGDIDDVVVLFNRQTAYTKEKLPDDYRYPIGESDDYWFNYAETDYEITTVMPSFCKGFKNGFVHAKTVSECLSAVKELITKPGKRFIYVYCPDPDMTMHDYGVTSSRAKKTIKSISAGLEELQKDSENTLFIISADHGQTDVTGTIDFYKDVELNDMLLCPPYLEPRATAFKVKDGFKRQFKKTFIKRYGEDFTLFNAKTLISQGYFGQRGEYGYLLGDYIAVCKTGKLMVCQKDEFHFKGHHTSLKEEMLVPLILFES